MWVSSFVFSTDLMNILLLNKTDIEKKKKKKRIKKKTILYLWSLKLQGMIHVHLYNLRLKKNVASYGVLRPKEQESIVDSCFGSTFFAHSSLCPVHRLLRSDFAFDQTELRFVNALNCTFFPLH